MRFEDISTEQELITYLDDANARLKNRDYVYHYTNINRAQKIFQSKKWHLKKAMCMNDALEHANGDSLRWSNLFFASFMTDTKESIGMWSMYGQPWNQGVILAIPTKVFIDWVNNVREVYEISCDNFTPTQTIIQTDASNRVFLSSVAYSNCDNYEKNEKLTWSNVANTKIKAAAHIPELTGYIKDSAWEYEREIRIKAVLQDGDKFSRIAIDIPDDVLKSIIVTTSPLFEGNLEDKLDQNVNQIKAIKQSLFSGKLYVDSRCDSCKQNQRNKKDDKKIST